MNERHVRDLLRRQIGGGGQKALAERIGVAPSYLSDVLTGRRGPGPRILSYLGLAKSYTREETRR